MRRLPSGLPGPRRFGTAMLPALALAAAFAAPAIAQDDHPVDSALEMMNLKADVRPMPDFVQQSRRDLSRDSYIPAGTKPAPRALTPKTPAEVQALTAELDAAHAAQLAGKRPAPPSVQAGGPAKPGAPLPLGRKVQATNR